MSCLLLSACRLRHLTGHGNVYRTQMKGKAPAVVAPDPVVSRPHSEAGPSGAAHVRHESGPAPSCSPPREPVADSNSRGVAAGNQAPHPAGPVGEDAAEELPLFENGKCAACSKEARCVLCVACRQGTCFKCYGSNAQPPGMGSGPGWGKIARREADFECSGCRQKVGSPVQANPLGPGTQVREPRGPPQRQHTVPAEPAVATGKRTLRSAAAMEKPGGDRSLANVEPNGKQQVRRSPNGLNPGSTGSVD